MNLLLAPSLFTLLTPLLPQARQDAPPGNEVLRWNRIATEALAAAQTDPLTESRTLAIVQLAVHDALVAVPAPSADAAIASAAHDAMVQLLPGAKTAFDGELARSLQSIPEGDVKSRGVDAGRASATANLAARAHDGSDRKVDAKAGSQPGQYRPTPPDLTPAWAAQWGAVTPFSLRSGDQFRPAPPPAVDGAVARLEAEQVRCIGGQGETMRNEEQSQIARFWYENSPQGWNRIARGVAQARGLDAAQSARLFALVNVAMADAYIVSLEAKYHYGYWRPVTAIRAAGASEWLSHLPTPPIPDYPSGHSVVGAAAATVLARFLENDFVAFETTSGQPYAGITRKFWSFSQAARENAASRVLAGIHFPTAVRVGCQVGDDVGAWVFEHALQPRGSEGAPKAASAPTRR